MKILFVVPYVPSLVRVRSYSLIRHLSQRGHQVTVLTLWSGERERADVETLRQLCHQIHAVRHSAWRSLWNCAQVLPTAEPLQAAYSWSAELSMQLRTLIPEADVIHVEHMRGARFALCAKAFATAARVPIVWDSVDCISYLFEQAVRARVDRVGRLINQLELSRTRRYEAWLLDRFDRVLVTSAIDRDALIALKQASDRTKPANGDFRSASQQSQNRVTVLPNGVDVNYFSPGNQTRSLETLVFSGKMSYHANVAAATHLIREIMPHIWKERPNAEVVIVGKDPPERLHSLAAKYSPRVRITGTVPDIRPYLRQASVAVVPLVYGAGSQFKVLEAMACETPVVATPQAVSALEVVQGRDVLVGDTPLTFAKEVLDLLNDSRKQRDVAQAGHRYVETHHRWQQISARLEAVYEEALHSLRVDSHVESFGEESLTPASSTQSAFRSTTNHVL